MTDISITPMTNSHAADWLGQARTLVASWRRRAVGRRQLASLSGYQLRDIGLSVAEANREVAKPFWQA